MKQFLILAFIFIAMSCTKQNHSENFLSNYSTYCGNAYHGEATFVDLASSELFENAAMTMHLNYCDDEEVRISFHIGDDRSRTWVLQMLNDRLHLSHDHRYEDGTEHDDNFYGGFADDSGNMFKQYFPADEQTIQDRPDREINTWAKEFDLAEMKYFYKLYLENELRLEIEFDLAHPIDPSGI